MGLFDAPQGNSSFAVNGQRDGSNNYMIDGADNNEVLSGIVTTLPPPEALGEFKLQTNAFSAEFGRAGGSVISVIRARAPMNSTAAFMNSCATAHWMRATLDRGNLPPLRQNEFGATSQAAIR